MTPNPDARILSAALGPDSPAVSLAMQRMESVYSESGSLAPVDNSYKYWVASRPFDADTSPGTFIRHTCLSLVCRLLAYRFLESRPSERDLWDVISGDYFSAAGLGNFLGEDFFSWPFFRLSMGIGDDALSIETAKGLLAALASMDLRQTSLSLIANLYAEYQDGDPGSARDATIPTTGFDPLSSCIAPYCGEGLALAQWVSTAFNARLTEGQIPPDALLDICEQFLGMTSDPLGATVASLLFLMALGDEVIEPHPPIVIPIYMAHGDHFPTERAEASGQLSYVIDAAGGVALPARVAADPLYLDWLFGRLPNYQRGAALRLRAQPEDVAVQEVLNAWYNYLTSPKARTPIPDPLTPEAADVMVEAARGLILQYVGGSGPGPLHLVRNTPAPILASQRTFDAMLWPSELAEADGLRETCAAHYLADGGQLIAAG